MMDEDLPGSPDDDMSSPQDYMCSPHDLNDADTTSPQSGGHDVNSDVEVDVWHPLSSD